MRTRVWVAPAVVATGLALAITAPASASEDTSARTVEWATEFEDGHRGRTAVDRAGELRLDARLGAQRNALQHRRQLLLAVDPLRVRPCSGTDPQASPDMRSRNRRRQRTPGLSAHHHRTPHDLQGHGKHQ